MSKSTSRRKVKAGGASVKVAVSYKQKGTSAKGVKTFSNHLSDALICVAATCLFVMTTGSGEEMEKLLSDLTAATESSQSRCRFLHGLGEHGPDESVS